MTSGRCTRQQGYLGLCVRRSAEGTSSHAQDTGKRCSTSRQAQVMSEKHGPHTNRALDVVAAGGHTILMMGLQDPTIFICYFKTPANRPRPRAYRSVRAAPRP